MHDFQEIAGIIAGIFSIAGYVPYMISIFKGKTLPNKATWMIWTLVGGLLAFSYLLEGDKNTIWLPLSYFLGPLIVAVLSLRYGYSTWTRLDKVCIIAAIISIVPWALAKNATLTLLLNVLIDAVGAIPTIIKTYREPATEDASAWLIFFIANTIELIAVNEWNIPVIYPIYLFILAGSMVALTCKVKVKNICINLEK